MNKLMKKSSKGASALPVILLVSGIIMEVVVAGLVVAQLFSSSLLSQQFATEALAVAKTGAQDAVNRVTSYVDCPDATYCPSTYTVTVGGRSACVNIGEIASNEMTIHSQSTVLTRQKTVEAVLIIDTSNAQVTVKTFKEVEEPDGFTSC